MAYQSWPTVNRWLTWFHRWAGVALCLLFVIWFASGAVLHFVGFPALSSVERIARSDEIELSRLELTPSDALARAGVAETDGLRLVGILGKPVYVASSGTSEVAVAGDTGERMSLLSAATAEAIAARFGHAPVLSVAGPLDYDQWVVHQRFDPYRPFFRARLADQLRTDFYVSARTGEVVQRTRASERAWNWCGAVVHWIFFTPLRKQPSVWNQLVWWLSLGALLTSVAGTWLGIHRYLKTRASPRRGLSPFRGWMRWHHVIGLFSSVVVLGWIFSGWLSVDEGRLFSRGGVTAEQSALMRGMPLDAIARATSLALVRSAGPATVITLNAVAGRPFLTIRGGAGSSASRLLWLNAAELSEAPRVLEAPRVSAPVPQRLLIAGLNTVWPGAEPVKQLTDTDQLYLRAELLPPDALAFAVGGSSASRVYVDQFSGRMLGTMDPGRRVYTWLSYGLHTYNFPGLNTYPTLRTAVVLLLVACGLGFSTTAVVLGLRRARLQLRDVTASRASASPASKAAPSGNI